MGTATFRFSIYLTLALTLQGCSSLIEPGWNKQPTIWSLTPTNSNRRFEVNLGRPLKLQIPREFCCSGAYTKTFQSIPERKNDSPFDSNYGIWLPPFGGLKAVQIDGTKTDTPSIDPSSIAPIIGITLRDFTQNPLVVHVYVDPRPTIYAGNWTGDVAFGPIPQLLVARDRWHQHQVMFPLVSAIFLGSLSAILFWIMLGLDHQDPVLVQFQKTTALWTIHFLFLSGTLRQWMPFLGGILHTPVASLTFASIAHLTATIVRINQPRLRQLRLASWIAFFLSIVFGLLDLEVLRTLLLLFVTTGVALLTLIFSKHANTSTQKIFFLLTGIASAGFLNDVLKLLTKDLGWKYPIMYLNRYSSLPMVLTSAYYIGSLAKQHIYTAAERETWTQASQQLAHDLRSPLAALKSAIKLFQQNSTDAHAILVGAAKRVEDILQSLVKPNTNLPIPLSLLKTIIDEIIAEKALSQSIHRHIKILTTHTSNNCNRQVTLSPTQFKRVLSNILDNSIEATITSGDISVTTNCSSTYVTIEVKDTGQGIPSSRYNWIGTRGATFGKERGSGLGLHYAVQSLSEWNGVLNIKPNSPQGTVVTLMIPLFKTGITQI